MSHIGVLASVAAVLSLAFLLFVVLAGYLAHPIIGGLQLEQLTRNVNLARSVFLWSLWLVVITSLIRHYRTEVSGFLSLLAGIACWVLLPLAVRTGISYESARPLASLGQSLISSFQTTGAILSVVSMLRLLVGRVLFMSLPRARARIPSSPTAAAEIAVERAAQRPSLMRRCWELQFCRGSLRSNCPRFLEGVSCWKRRSGCYCDQGLATRLLAGVGVGARVEVAEELDAAQRRARQLSQRPSRRPKRSKPPCGECPIYLEHQTYKYRVLSWLAYPAAAAIVGLTARYLHTGYEWVSDKLGVLSVSIDRTGQGNVYYLPQWLSFENAMILVMGVLAVVIILHLTEVLVFRFKL